MSSTDLDKFEHSYKLVYRFQKKDDRDHLFSIHPDNNAFVLKTRKDTIKIAVPQKLPTTFNVFNIVPFKMNILDQGILGNCVSNSFALNISYQSQNNLNLCRLLHYDICRILDGSSLYDDAGTTVRTACDALLKYGSCPESIYPYNNVNVSNYSLLAPLNTFLNSKLFKSFKYTFVQQDLTSLKTCLNTTRVPIIFGFLIYDSFMTNNVAKTGIVPMPDIKKETNQGGHCMNIIGYDDVKQSFICANSWGTLWGDKGLCYIPYNYLTNPSLASDFCYIQFTR